MIEFLKKFFPTKKTYSVFEFFALDEMAGTIDSSIDSEGSKIGNGTYKTQIHPIAGKVSSLDISGPWKGILRLNAPSNECKISFEENLLKNIEVTFKKGKLHIGFIGSFFATLSPVIELSLTNTPGKMDFSGECEIDVSPLVGETVKSKISGASIVTFDSCALNILNIKLSGASSLMCQGESLEADINVSGASELNSFMKINLLDLFLSGSSTAKIDDAYEAEVHVSGASSLKIKAIKELTGSVTGVSEILYSGVRNPSIDVSGASELKRH